MVYLNIVIKALRNIIHKQTQSNMNSRFLYMKILKEINNVSVIASLSELKQFKYIKDKSFSKILQEIKKLSGSVEFRNIITQVEQEVENLSNNIPKDIIINPLNSIAEKDKDLIENSRKTN